MSSDSQSNRSAMEQADAASWGDIVRSIRRHMLYYALVPVICVAIGIGYLIVSEPLYRSEAVIFPISSDDSTTQLGGLAGQFGGLASLAGIDIPSSSSTAESIAFLRSRQLIQQLVERAELMPVLFAADWDNNDRTWLDEEPTMEDAVELFAADIRTIVDDQDGGAIVVRIEWGEPVLAAQWAAELVAIANAHLRQRAIEEARASMEYLQQELQSTSIVRMEDAINGMMESEMQAIMLANVRPEYAFRIIDPPRVSDPDDYIWPNAVIVIGAALMSGIALSLLIAVMCVAPRPA